MIDNVKASMLIYHLLNDLCLELHFKNGAMDLEHEEPAVCMELMQIVQERLQTMYKLMSITESTNG